MCAASSPIEGGRVDGPAPSPGGPASAALRGAPGPAAALSTGPVPPEQPRPRFLRRRRAEAAAAIAPLFALFALMPPFIHVFAHDGRVFGAPSILVFLLAVWLGLILVSRRLARRLSAADPEP